MINLGRRGAAVLIAVAGIAAFGGGVGIAALTSHRASAPSALVSERPIVLPTAAASRTPSATPQPSATRSPSATPRTTPTPSGTASPRTGTVDAAKESQVVALTNRARVSAGCAPLRIDSRITRAAQAHSDDMARRGYFDHDSRNGRDFVDRMRAAGYPNPGAENIAVGQTSSSEVMQAWLASPGHRRNILDCTLTTIGVGYAADGSYWTQDFGR
ncbi:CAP domain-containing protein [Pseudonocardia sp. CA-107938]|uniref:CAP domain-containing protein n=1 Tax=Pseudonocardia sp. CA-107938 TaxID=3240021 RepID=UPI003D8A4837